MPFLPWNRQIVLHISRHHRFKLSAVIPVARLASSWRRPNIGCCRADVWVMVQKGSERWRNKSKIWGREGDIYIYTHIHFFIYIYIYYVYIYIMCLYGFVFRLYIYDVWYTRCHIKRKTLTLFVYWNQRATLSFNRHWVSRCGWVSRCLLHALGVIAFPGQLKPWHSLLKLDFGVWTRFLVKPLWWWSKKRLAFLSCVRHMSYHVICPVVI